MCASRSVRSWNTKVASRTPGGGSTYDPAVPRFVAFLRAVNVGGTGLITMADVRRTFESLGLADVATVGASGNVLFTGKGAPAALRRKLEEALARRLGKPATVVLRTSGEMKAVVRSAPFGRSDDDNKTYVAFLTEPVGKSAPARMPGFDVKFPSPREGEVFVVAARTTPPGTDVGGFLQKALGKVPATLRTWKVVQALALKAAGP